MSNAVLNTQKEVIAKDVLKLVFHHVKGTSFVGIRNYESKSSGNEIANHTILVGVNRKKVLQKDFDKLVNYNVQPVIDKLIKKVSNDIESLPKKYQKLDKLEIANYVKDNVNKAKFELITALQKTLATEQEKSEMRADNDSTINRSDAQKDAYTYINHKGIKYHTENKEIYLFGYAVNKTVLVEGNKKPTKSQLKTIAKRMIQKEANIYDRKFRQFKFSGEKLANLKMQGIEIPF